MNAGVPFTSVIEGFLISAEYQSRLEESLREGAADSPGLATFNQQIVVGNFYPSGKR
jgi:hypothetical protein